MLFTLLLSVLSAAAFRRTARVKGYYSPQIWIFPLAIGGVITVVAFVLDFVVQISVVYKDSGILLAYAYFVDVLAIIFLCAIISKAWTQLKALPPKNSSA